MTSPNPTPLLSPHLFPPWVFPRISAFLSLCLCLYFILKPCLPPCWCLSPSALPLPWPPSVSVCPSVTQALSVPDSLGHAFNRHTDTIHGPPPL